MDDEELASLFAAKQENEELKAKVARLEKEVEHRRRFTRGLTTVYQPVYDRYGKMKAFINLLDEHPMFWASSYKRSIKQFILDNFPIDYENLPEK
jgi:hypothetical protein